jgi:hypothetical protein
LIRSLLTIRHGTARPIAPLPKRAADSQTKPGIAKASKVVKKAPPAVQVFEPLHSDHIDFAFVFKVSVWSSRSNSAASAYRGSIVAETFCLPRELSPCVSRQLERIRLPETALMTSQLRSSTQPAMPPHWKKASLSLGC